MDLGLEDKCAVVLASSGGLGRAVAEALLAEGARVTLSGRDPTRLEGTLEELRATAGDRVHGEVLDVTRGADLRGHLARARERQGAVDILVTNSGGPAPGAAADLDGADLDAAFDLLLRSTVTAVHTVLPWMRARRFGRILGMTSSAVRQPIEGLALSNTLRAGVTGYLKTLSREVAGDGVLVNTICTGMFDTERLAELFEDRARRSGRAPAEERAAAEAEIPVGRIGDLQEFGALAAFLVSERASFLSGVALACDGGASRFLL